MNLSMAHYNTVRAFNRGYSEFAFGGNRNLPLALQVIFVFMGFYYLIQSLTLKAIIARYSFLS